MVARFANPWCIHFTETKLCGRVAGNVEILEDLEVNLDVGDLFNRFQLDRELVGRRLKHSKRGSGHHVSGILYQLGLAGGYVKNYEEVEGIPKFKMLFALGFMWEEFILSFYEECEYQPGEHCEDGIYMNCDGRSYLPEYDGEPLIEECKFTFKKMHTSDPEVARTRKLNLIQDQWMWIKQVQSYCKGYKSVLARLHVMHVKGDYKKFEPVYKRYVMRFTQEEIDRTWNMIKANRELAEMEVHG